MYRMAICDDDKVFLDKLEKCIGNYTKKYGIVIEKKAYYHGGFLLDDVYSGMQYDIYILDIEMPEIRGTDIVKKLRQVSSEAIVIFVTSYLQYALESFELEIFRYIPKEALEERLPGALKAAFLKLDSQDGQYYSIMNTKRFEKVFYKDIVYIYKNEKNSNFVLSNGTEVKARETLLEVRSKLPESEFLQADRCYIVNICHIHKVDSVNRTLVLKNEIKLQISKAKIPEIKKKISQFWGERV